MQAKVDQIVAPSRDYQDYVPSTDIVEEKDCDTLLIYLPGFKKDQLRVQLTQTPSLKISGERLTVDNKWSRFQKEFPVSKICDISKITAKFDSGILYIRQPKLATPEAKKDEEKPIDGTQIPQKNETEPPLPQNKETKDDINKMEDENNVSPESDKTGAGDAAQKSQEEEEKKQSKHGDEKDGKRKRKRVEELLSGDFMNGRMKMAKNTGTKMSIVVVVLAATAVGICVKNLITS